MELHYVSGKNAKQIARNVKECVGNLKDPDAAIRLAALQGIRKALMQENGCASYHYADKAVLLALIRVLAEEKDVGVRKAILTVLEEFDDLHISLDSATNKYSVEAARYY